MGSSRALEVREQKKDSKTCEEEIQRLADGRELHTRKTRTYNMKQSSKHITIRTHGGGQDQKVQKFEDGDLSFNEDLDTDFFSPRRTGLWNRHRARFGMDSFESTKDDDDLGAFEIPPENATSQKVKKVEHTNAVTQSVFIKIQEKSKKSFRSVAKTEKRNGKIVSDNAAHKLDRCELKAKQVENYQGERLLNRCGDGYYEEQSIVRPGLPGTSGTENSEELALLPKKRHVVEYMQTFGGESEGKDDFFKASTLASYVLLNDNLRFHEEQYKKNIQFKFSLNGFCLLD
uniref:Shugoshin_C domain-containing protein n=1 Tax=Syphacia muris TaxID=451379 RepID=A0A0N5APS0_9BILA